MNLPQITEDNVLDYLERLKIVSRLVVLIPSIRVSTMDAMVAQLRNAIGPDVNTNPGSHAMSYINDVAYPIVVDQPSLDELRQRYVGIDADYRTKIGRVINNLV